MHDAARGCRTEPGEDQVGGLCLRVPELTPCELAELVVCAEIADCLIGHVARLTAAERNLVAVSALHIAAAVIGVLLKVIVPGVRLGIGRIEVDGKQALNGVIHAPVPVGVVRQGVGDAVPGDPPTCPANACTVDTGTCGTLSYSCTTFNCE